MSRLPALLLALAAFVAVIVAPVHAASHEDGDDVTVCELCHQLGDQDGLLPPPGAPSLEGPLPVRVVSAARAVRAVRPSVTAPPPPRAPPVRLAPTT